MPTAELRPRANLDAATVEGFGAEWSLYQQDELSFAERSALFDRYFHGFPWHALPRGALGGDLGCGSGRWAELVAPRTGGLLCIDASARAIAVAEANLAGAANCSFALASVGELPVASESLDFAYSLGVLHHLPDTAAAVVECARCLKPGAPFLVYLYYAFDNRPAWYRAAWRASDLLRRLVSRLPPVARSRVTTVIAGFVYWPLARLAGILARCGVDVWPIPLSAYRAASFYTMRTDALDRFGTRLERRFTRAEIRSMMEAAGLERISFSNSVPYWCAIGYRCRDA